MPLTLVNPAHHNRSSKHGSHGSLNGGHHYATLEQEFYHLCENKIKHTCGKILHSIHEMKAKKEDKKQIKELHRKQAKFLALGLERLPFLYSLTVETENYHWIKLAYDLYEAGDLIPETVRYQVGPEFFVSFGSIANQIKREFFTLFSNNCEAANIHQLLMAGSKKTDSLTSLTISHRDCAIDTTFEFFTIEEIRKMILQGDRNTADFSQCLYPNDDSQTDWYHKWGWAYETNEDAIRAIDLKLGNFYMELSFLDTLKELNLQDVPVVSKNCLTVSDLIDEKKNLITGTLLPELQELKETKLKCLSKVKRYSQAYYDILHY